MKDILEIKNYLDLGTNEGLRFSDESLSRYVSFKKCFEYLLTLPNPKILELGTSRSFVDGKFEGCNSNNTKYWDKNDISKWDWGAGCFTLLFGLSFPKAKLTTVDLIKSHIVRCKYMTDSFNLSNIDHVISDSLEFLQKTEEKYDLIYLDTGDMWPIEPTLNLQLQEAKFITEKKLLNNNGILLIDDVLNGTPRELGDKKNKYGKSELSIPYLKSQNFKLFMRDINIF